MPSTAEMAHNWRPSTACRIVSTDRGQSHSFTRLAVATSMVEGRSKAHHQGTVLIGTAAPVLGVRRRLGTGEIADPA